MKKEIQELIDRPLEANLKVKHTHRRPCHQGATDA